ncbi:peptidase propeptide and YPEB domain protein [mine drainage metagenome]|uniref:Peptidase propeptide and YPEB domain protein n=1 Tax=mine drainage metagenome TaxID=410659 RepID=A0A1J5S7U7_9ZZZZ
MKFKPVISFAVASAAVLGATTAAQAFDGQQYSRDAKISLEQARQTALKELPGATIIDQELEHEKGGSGLRYSFDLKVGQGKREIGVDAVTGKLLENSVEGPNAD